jgi:hypothetical protein
MYIFDDFNLMTRLENLKRAEILYRIYFPVGHQTQKVPRGVEIESEDRNLYLTH